MDKIKVALIGAGAMANSVHYPSLVEFLDVEIVGLCDVVEDKLRATAPKFKIKNSP
jgi:predicted dehydrogenase